MGIIAWVILGLIAGSLASFVLPGSRGCILTTLVGVVGSVVGGYLATLLGYGGISGFDLRSLVISFLGTLTLLGPWLWLSKRRVDSGDSTAPLKTLNRQVKPVVQRVSHPVRKPEPEPAPRDIPAARPQTGGQRSKIFISYRRADSADVSGRLYDRLSDHFGEENVFKDVDSIPFGVDFRDYIESMIAVCSVLLVVIGRQWLGSGKSRLEDPHDFVRLEIEAALKRKIRVIPVLVQEAGLPAEESLPSSLKALAYRQSTRVRSDPDFHRDVDRLIDGLERPLSPNA